MVVTKNQRNFLSSSEPSRERTRASRASPTKACDAGTCLPLDKSGTMAERAPPVFRTIAAHSGADFEAGRLLQRNDEQPAGQTAVNAAHEDAAGHGGGGAERREPAAEFAAL